MFYVRTKGRLLKLRDFDSMEMKTIGPRQWVMFGALPPNVNPHHDHDLEVKEIVSDADLASVEAENARMAEAEAREKQMRAEREAGRRAEKAEKEAAAVAVVAEPKRRSRVR